MIVGKRLALARRAYRWLAYFLSTYLPLGWGVQLVLFLPTRAKGTALWGATRVLWVGYA